MTETHFVRFDLLPVCRHGPVRSTTRLNAFGYDNRLHGSTSTPPPPGTDVDNWLIQIAHTEMSSLIVTRIPRYRVHGDRLWRPVCSVLTSPVLYSRVPFTFPDYFTVFARSDVVLAHPDSGKNSVGPSRPLVLGPLHQYYVKALLTNNKQKKKVINIF